MRWYRKAAEQGFAEAQCNLGVMYRLGRGVPQDDAEAMRWYRKAAKQGNAQAQNGLIIMYEETQPAEAVD
jgi:TPR repeat protein